MSADMDSPKLSSVRVLVAEDEADTREIIAAVLERHGATVWMVGTAEAALERLQEWQPHVLVSDLELPGRSGYWLIGQVRSLPAERGGETPAAAVTGLTGPEDRAQVLRSGFQYHLPKPIDIRTLVGVVTILALKR